MVLYLEKIVLCICITLITEIKSNENKIQINNFWDYYYLLMIDLSNELNNINGNDVDELINMFFRKDIYRRLKVTPWVTLEELEHKYVNIINDSELENAFNELKERLIERGPIPISYVIGEYFCNIFILICVFLLFYYIVYVVYFILELFYVFLLSEVVGFIIVGNLIPHLFVNMIYQYICSVIVGVVVFYFTRMYKIGQIQKKMRKKLMKKKKKMKKLKNKSKTIQKKSSI